jgi:hypothetical protein
MLLLLLLVAPASSQTTPDIGLQANGRDLGRIRTLNITGAGYNATLRGQIGDLSIDPSALLDRYGNVQGSILYRGATAWTTLPPGTSGYVLQTQGAGANPIWAAGGGGGGGAPGGASGTVQYNNAGVFGGFGAWTGTALTIPGSVTIATRTGTPATVAMFTAGGLLTEVATLANSFLTNPSLIVNGVTCTLGSSCLTGSAPASGTFLVTGGGVTWVSGYTFNVSAATYYLNGVLFASPEATVTLAAADPSLDRIDTIILNASSVATKVTGQAAAPPFQPSLDPETQLGLTSVYVAAGSTTPAIVNTVIYDENTGGPGEWNASTAAGTFALGSTNFPNTGTKDIEATNAVLGDTLDFVKPSGTIDLGTQEIVKFFIRVKAAWPANKRLRVRWYSGGVQRGIFVDVRTGQFGFNSATTGVYQQIVVPIAQFGVPAGATVDEVTIAVVGGGANVGFYLDTLSLQAGLSQPPPLAVLPGGGVGALQYNLDGSHFGGIPPSTDDSVLVSNGTSWNQTALPNCLDTGGQHLNYAAASNSFSCGTSGGGGGGGTVTTTGSPASGNLAKFSGATSITNADLTGDVTTSGGVVTAIAANAVTLAKLATQANQTILSNISGGVAVPAANTLTAILDNILSSTQGTVIFRGASTWTTLAPGTSGQFLKTLGSGADPVWDTPAGGGGGTIANQTILSNISGSTAAASGNTLTAILDNILSSTQGTIVYRGASVWTTLAPGTSGQFLQTLGASANPQWATPAASSGGIATVKTYTNIVHPSLNTGSLIHTSLTNRSASYFQVPYTITANQMSVAVLTATTPGTLKLCIYSQDGATKLIDQTVTPSANATISATLSPAVVLGPGEYWFVAGCATACSVSLTAAISPTVPFTVTASPAGKTAWTGLVAHTSGTCNSTLGTLTSTANGIPVVRFDN